MNPKAPPAKKEDRRPTPDQMFLAERLNSGPWNDEETGPLANMITPAALQRWNMIYGVAAVSDAMRTAWGFPPLGGIENPYSYVDAILKGAK